jgi:GDP-L-fucose synthase
LRLLITGASGVVGRAFAARAALDPQIDVVALSGRDDGDLEQSQEARAIVRFVKPDAIVHLAAAVHGLGGNLKFPADVYRRNILINTHVLDACREFNVGKVVAMGTTAIYSDTVTIPFSETDCLLGEPHGSEYAYATAKRAMLVQLRSYSDQYGLKYAYAIATNMYGPHDRFDAENGHVVPSLISKFQSAQTSSDDVTIWGDGAPTRDFLYSDDAAEGLLLLLKLGEGTFNLATGHSRSIADLVEVLKRHYPGVTVKWDENKPRGQLKRSYSIERLTSLGYSPQYMLEDGIGKTIEWYRKNFFLANLHT